MHNSKRLAYWSYQDGVALLKLNNPPVNVIDLPMKNELKQCVVEIEADKQVRVVIITGEGDRAFVAGGNIKEFPDMMSAGQAWSILNDTHRIFNRLANLSRPTIAAINGLTLGGGLELALSCDFRIAAEHALIGLPETRLGLFPGAGGTQRLTRLVGSSWAKQIIFSGEPITAAEALKIGLVSQVVPGGQALPAALELAAKLKNRPRAALSYIKQLVDEGGELLLRNGLRMEKEYTDLVFRTGRNLENE